MPLSAFNLSEREVDTGGERVIKREVLARFLLPVAGILNPRSPPVSILGSDHLNRESAILDFWHLIEKSGPNPRSPPVSTIKSDPPSPLYSGLPG